MESALTIVPPSFSARASAKADLPLAVGPAMRMVLGTSQSSFILPLGSHGMFYVATLISAPDRPAVTDTLARKAAHYLPHGRPVDWLSPGVALDIAFLVEDAEPGEVPALLKDMAGDLRDIIGGEAVDVVIQPQDNRRKKLLVADMDSTMIGQECIDELADFAGLRSRVAA